MGVHTLPLQMVTGSFPPPPDREMRKASCNCPRARARAELRRWAACSVWRPGSRSCTLEEARCALAPFHQRLAELIFQRYPATVDSEFRKTCVFIKKTTHQASEALCADEAPGSRGTPETSCRTRTGAGPGVLAVSPCTGRPQICSQPSRNPSEGVCKSRRPKASRKIPWPRVTASDHELRACIRACVEKQARGQAGQAGPRLSSQGPPAEALRTRPGDAGLLLAMCHTLWLTPTDALGLQRLWSTQRRTLRTSGPGAAPGGRAGGSRQTLWHHFMRWWRQSPALCGSA